MWLIFRGFVSWRRAVDSLGSGYTYSRMDGGLGAGLGRDVSGSVCECGEGDAYYLCL